MQKLLFVFHHSEIAPQAKSGKYFQILFFPRFGGKKWRRSEHAHASYPGLFFRPPGFSPYMGREERGVQGLDYSPWSSLRFDALTSLSHIADFFDSKTSEDLLVPFIGWNLTFISSSS